MAKKLRKPIALAMVMYILVSMIPVQALADENNGDSAAQAVENVNVNLTVEGNQIVVEFAPTENTEGSVEWESNLTLGETVDVEVTDVTVTTENSEVVIDDSSDAGEMVDGAVMPDKTTIETVTESVTVETKNANEEGPMVEGTETVIETTTTTKDTFVEISSETVKESVTVKTVVEGEETITGSVETVAPGEEVPSVTVPVPGSDDIKVEENVEGEVVKTENEDGSITTSQTSQTVTEKKDETTGSVTNVETITTTETVKSPEKEQLEDGDVMTETTTTTTIEKTTEETENGETSETVKVTVNVTEDTTEIFGDVKEGEDDAEYDYTISTETTEREVELEITDNGVKLEDVATGLVGEQEVVLKGLDPVYDETDNWKDGGDSYPGQPDDAAGKLGLYDRNYLSSETMDYVTMGDIIIWLNDSSKIITDIYVPEGSELPEDFAYSVGSNVSSWFDGTNPKQSKLPAGMNVGKNNVAINNIETWYNADGDLILDIPEEADFRFVGTGEHGNYWNARVTVIYEKDDDGNTKYDENGRPIIKAIQKKNGTPITIDGKPATELPDGVTLEPIYDDYNGGRPKTFMLMDKEGNRVYAYCADMDTDTSEGAYYSVSNLEDSEYYASEESEEHIRSIVMNGYWGTSDIQKEDGSYETGSLEGIKQNLRDAINSGEMDNEVIQMPVVDAEGNPVVDEHGNPVMESKTMLELIDDMTEGEALLATQSAIWSYSNGSINVQSGKDGVIVVDPDGYQWNNQSSSKVDVNEPLNDYGSARVDFLYRWLIGLETEEESTVIINENNFVDEVALTIHEKVEDETIAENYDDDDTNDVYNTDLNFRLAFIPGENDDLLVQITYTDLDGKLVNVTRRLAGENSEGQDYEYILPEEDGSYLLKGLKLSENKEFDFDLRLEGTQYLEQGVYVYAPVGGREVSQTFVGIAEGDRNVDVSASMSISFNVNEENQVVVYREWREENDPETSTTNTTVTPPDEEEEPPTPPARYRMSSRVGQLETIIDEEVPLAEVPPTGDISILWFALIMMSACGLWILYVSDKKCKA